MRRLLILSLLFGLAGAACGVLHWEVTGSTAGTGIATDVMAGDELILELIVSDDMAAAVKIDHLTDNGADGVITNVTSPFDYGTDGMSGEDWNGQPFPGLPDPFIDDDGDWAQIDKFTTTTPLDGAILIVNYTVGEDIGLVTISAEGLDILGGNAFVMELAGVVDVPSLELNVIPEPLGVVLVGVGGVVVGLRRR